MEKSPSFRKSPDKSGNFFRLSGNKHCDWLIMVAKGRS